MLLEAVPRLEDRRSGELVDLDDPPIRAVVETAIDADRAVDPMHHADTVPGEAAESVEVEVERVVEARGSPAGEAVDLDGNAATGELGLQREEELVPAAVRRLVELVEDREVPSVAARADVVG